MNKPHGESTASFREVAREHLRCGRLNQAERWFLRLIDVTPDDLEAILFISGRLFARGEHVRAIELLSIAENRDPDNAAVLQQLGALLLAEGDFTAAVAKLQRGLNTAPDMFVARLKLGVEQEQLGDAAEALSAYAVAIRIAQEKGRWLDDESTAPGLRDLVRYAIRYVNTGRRDLFHSVMEPLRKRYGSSELVRVERCLATYLGEQSASLPDPRQQPKFLFFPGLPSQPYYPRERFPWMAELEAGAAGIREELLAVLAQEQGLESFLLTDAPQGTADLLQSSGVNDPAWDAYFFYRHGVRHDENCLRSPYTSGLLDQLPLVRIRDHAPETLFSVLCPGTHILPHHGVTNTRLVTHLPLIVPPDCALRVGGEMHVWQEGRCVTFDDTFEHEAWNKSAETRVVLIVDSWNPDLSEAERAVLTDLVGVIGDFNRACER